MLLGALDELLESVGIGSADPILIFLRGRRIDHAGDMAGARKDEPLRAIEMVHDLPHALGRGDMVLAPSLDVGGRLDLADVDWSPGNLDLAGKDQLVPLVERLE